MEKETDRTLTDFTIVLKIISGAFWPAQYFSSVHAARSTTIGHPETIYGSARRKTPFKSRNYTFVGSIWG